jgi:MoxR-like ATPase
MAEETLGIDALNEQVKAQSAFVQDLRNEMEKVIVGQTYLIDRLIIGLLANGHLLLEGVPGLAKTLSVRTLAACLHTSFQRIQFTPDLLPADLIGTEIYNPKEGAFTLKKGPVFANIILADEINRAPAKVQSALLEAMQERQVTIGHESFRLPEPFLVLATENPIEQEGTYPLPEAQVDRFMLKLRITYPTLEEERKILDAMAFTQTTFTARPVIEPDTLLQTRRLVDQIYVDDKIKDYILSLIFATREPDRYQLRIGDYLRYGASPRATINLTLAARAHAFLNGRGYVTPQDVKSMAPDVLRHRVIVSYEAEAEELTSDDLVQRILDELPVP